MEAGPINGFINLLKPPGITSSGAVVAIRRTLHGEKVGHAGTLDPEAAGVLPIMVGKASRLFDVLTEKEKEYIVEIAFGVSTDTQDAQGKVLARSTVFPALSSIQSILPRFIGDLLQTPPAYSALKINGRPAYALARQGKEVSIAPRSARIDAIELIEQTAPDSALLRVRCGKGVYMRTLCHDIGIALGCPAHMRFLLRTQSGFFSIDHSITLDEWQTCQTPEGLLTPMDAPLAHLPLARVGVAYQVHIQRGNAMTCFETIDEEAFAGGPTRVYCGETFAGLASWRDGALRFQAMLMGE